MDLPLTQPASSRPSRSISVEEIILTIDSDVENENKEEISLGTFTPTGRKPNLSIFIKL